MTRLSMTRLVLLTGEEPQESHPLAFNENKVELKASSTDSFGLPQLPEGPSSPTSVMEGKKQNTFKTQKKALV